MLQDFQNVSQLHSEDQLSSKTWQAYHGNKWEGSVIVFTLPDASIEDPVQSGPAEVEMARLVSLLRYPLPPAYINITGGASYAFAGYLLGMTNPAMRCCGREGWGGVAMLGQSHQDFKHDKQTAARHPSKSKCKCHDSHSIKVSEKTNRAVNILWPDSWLLL